MSITKLTILDPAHAARVTSKKKEFTFSPGINVLVGPNGSGKSTILNAIRSTTENSIRSTVASIEISDSRFPMPILFHDTEQAARVQTANSGSNLLSIQANVESHGQSLLRYAMAIESQTQPSVFIIDEGETGLSIESIIKFRELIISGHEKWGHQFILSSHSVIFWYLPNAKIINLGPKGYVDDCLNKLKKAVVQGKKLNKEEQR